MLTALRARSPRWLVASAATVLVVLASDTKCGPLQDGPPNRWNMVIDNGR